MADHYWERKANLLFGAVRNYRLTDPTMCLAYWEERWRVAESLGLPSGRHTSQRKTNTYCDGCREAKLWEKARG